MATHSRSNAYENHHERLPPITVVNSMDPNDKSGPSGVSAQHHLKGDSMMPYNMVFDVNDPILTPVWVNSIDKTPPTSQVNALPAVQNSVTFPVTWSGGDAGAGIASFSIYVSEDGGPFALLLNETKAASATFSGLAGKTYRFFSAAQAAQITAAAEQIRTRLGCPR